MLNPYQKKNLRFPLNQAQKNWKAFSNNKNFGEKPTYPIVDLYEKLTNSHPKGKYFNKYLLVLCPFHGERHPSLALYTETNTYFCFSCSVSGDIYKMVMILENKTFPEALDYIRSL